MYEEFPHEIELEEYTSEQLPGGGWSDPVWSVAVETEAFISPVSGDRRIRAMSNDYPLDVELFVPYQDGIRPGMQFTHDGRRYEVNSDAIDQGGQQEILMYECKTTDFPSSS